MDNSKDSSPGFALHKMVPQFLKPSCMTLFRWLSSGVRSCYARNFSETCQWPAAILFYHRVSNYGKDGWSIHVNQFRRHLDWLQANCELVSLSEIQKSQFAGRRDKLQVAITFDDGYYETVEYGVPLLLERQIPFTYFVSTYFAETGLPFPHDTQIGADYPPNTIEQIQWMAENGVDIGAHTQSHANLGQPLCLPTLRKEIVDCRKILQDWTGQAIRYFSFPYGLVEHISQAAIDVVHEAGYRGFVSAWGEWNQLGSDPYHLRRIHGDPSLAMVKNWLMLDPRKLAIRKHCPERPMRMQQSQNGEQPMTCLFPEEATSASPLPSFPLSR